MYAAIRATEYYLPARGLSNEELVREFPAWTAEDVAAKTGIRNRQIAAEDELASDLGVEAARKLFESGHARPLISILSCFARNRPTISCHNRLPRTAAAGRAQIAGALDFNLGCSGFVYGLSLAKGLVETGEARNVLLLTCETYSKHIDPADFSNVPQHFRRCGGGDAHPRPAGRSRGGLPWIGPFVYGTDGSGEANLIVVAAGASEDALRSQNVAGRIARISRTALDGWPGHFFIHVEGSAPSCAELFGEGPHRYG